MNSRKPVIIILVALLAAAGSGYWMLQNSGQNSPASGSPTPESAVPAATPTIELPPGTGRGVVVLEEFGDYQCPPCGNLHPTLTTIKKEYGDRLRFIFHHFPLRQIHANAQAAAEAAVAAGSQNKLWEMHNLLYENQTAWSESPDMQSVTSNFARSIGLDLNRFLADTRSTRTASTIATDVEQGMRRGVDSTPTLFINGEKIPFESYDAAGLRREIDRRMASN
jgi:protein-disulfide isomerase